MTHNPYEDQFVFGFESTFLAAYALHQKVDILDCRRQLASNVYDKSSYI